MIGCAMVRILLSTLLLSIACSSDGANESFSDPAGKAQASESGNVASDLGHALDDKERELLVPAKEAGVIFKDVKYSKDTVLVEGEALAALTKHDTKAHRYTFSKSKAASSKLVLEKGKVLLIAGLALRRITEVKEQGDAITVETEFASIADAIVEGEVGWKSTLSMNPKHITALILPDGRELPFGDAVQYADLGNALNVPLAPKLNWNFTDGPMTYKLELDPKRDSIGVKVQLTRKLANTGSLAYVAEGTIRSLQVEARAVYKDGEAKSFDFVQDNLGGDFKLSMAAAGGGKMEISKEVPGLMLKWVILVGPIPITISATAKIIGRVTLPAKGSSMAEARFSFRGKGGFHYDGGEVRAEFGMAKENFEPKPFDAAGFIGETVDNQFGVAFPVLKVAAFDSFFIPRFLTGATIGVSLTWGPVCKRGYVKYTAKAGYDFKVFGVTLASLKDQILFEKEKKAKQEGCK